jgi:hypothetical protein
MHVSHTQLITIPKAASGVLATTEKSALTCILIIVFGPVTDTPRSFSWTRSTDLQ